MKLSRILASTFALSLVAAGAAAAQTATQNVAFEVDAINQIAVTGTPNLVINAAAAGSAPTSVTSTGNSWAVTTNQTNAKVTASIASAMPTGVTLSVQLAAPTGATSTGMKALGTAGVDVVTGITKLNAASLALTYELDATAAAGVLTSTTRMVTYTVTGGV